MKRFLFMSYVKTLATFVLLMLVALLFAVISQRLATESRLYRSVDEFFALITFTFVYATAIVLVRYKRGVRGEPDLFLELKRSACPLQL